MRDFAEILELRAAMHANGYRVLPCVEASKAPLFTGWPDYIYRPADPETPIPRTRNREGKPTRIAHLGTSVLTTDIECIDIDINDAVKAHAARVAFEEAAGERAGMVRVRANSPRRMLFYRAGAGVAAISATFGDDPVKLEIFSHPGRQVMTYGRHPSGVLLEYEGDGPRDMPVADLPPLDRATLNRATMAALEAAGIKTGANGGAPPESKARSVRRQTTMGGVVTDLAATLHEIATGSSVHNASKRLADLLTFQLGLDDEQAEALLTAVAGMATRLTPAEADRFAEMASKAASRASWYAERAENPPEADPDGVVDPVKLGYWRTARARQIARAWRLLPADLRDEFARDLLQHHSKMEAAHGRL